MSRLQKTCGEVYGQIRFLERMPEEEYLNVLSLVDVALDTLHYGGGANTCYDAFAAGTPLITLTGSFHRSRFATAAYQQMGYTRCVTKNPDEYIHLAVEIASNKNLRKQISDEILQKSSVLFEDKEAVLELENTFESLIFNIK
jgi:predicted O-linked N-acetylglucosamine transferase (SPINDLY family)